MKHRPITLKDMALKLNTSVATVSRALKENPDISQEMRTKVKSLAAELNYQPNPVALNLKYHKTQTIAIVIPKVVHFMFSTMLSGILEEAERYGYNVPLPHLRGEVIYGVDAAAPPLDADSPILADRRMLGAYAQIAQPLWRRKKTRLPGLIIQYRFDHADPDLTVPGRTAAGKPIVSDFADAFKYDEALQAHVIGLRFPVLPRFTLKAEYDFVREEGGRTNRLFNDAFGFQAVADF